MSIFTRVRDTWKFLNSKEFQEIRSYSQTIFSGSGLLPTYINSTGENVSAETALRISTWFSCLQIRWDAVGMLPFQIYRVDENTGRKTLARDLPIYEMLSCRPNASMTATSFWKLVQQKRDNYGNAYCPITRDGKNITQIGLIANPNEVEVYSAGYELFYKYKGEQISSADMLHFKGLTTSGKTGLSLTEYHAETVGRLRAIQKFSNRSVSTNPGMYATTANQQAMGEKQAKAFQDYWQKQLSGYGDQGQMPVLYNGYELKTAGINPKDALYLEQIQATRQDIYGITKVSPALVKDYQSGNTYNNGSQQNLDFLIWTLQPMIKEIEEECDYKLFDSRTRQDFECKFNEKALMRTDMKTQAEWLEKMFMIGAYSINDILRYLDENPIEGGDDHFVPGNNLVPLRLLDEVLKNKQAQPAQPSQPDPAKRNGHHIDKILT